MPKSKTIKVVDVDKPEGLEVAQTVEPNEESLEDPITEPIVEQADVKPKATKQPRTKKNVESLIEPAVLVTSEFDEIVAEVTMSTESVK